MSKRGIIPWIVFLCLQGILECPAQGPPGGRFYGPSTPALRFPVDAMADGTLRNFSYFDSTGPASFVPGNLLCPLAGIQIHGGDGVGFLIGKTLPVFQLHLTLAEDRPTEIGFASSGYAGGRSVRLPDGSARITWEGRDPVRPEPYPVGFRLERTIAVIPPREASPFSVFQEITTLTLLDATATVDRFIEYLVVDDRGRSRDANRNGMLDSLLVYNHDTTRWYPIVGKGFLLPIEVTEPESGSFAIQHAPVGLAPEGIPIVVSEAFYVSSEGIRNGPEAEQQVLERLQSLIHNAKGHGRFMNGDDFEAESIETESLQIRSAEQDFSLRATDVRVMVRTSSNGFDLLTDRWIPDASILNDEIVIRSGNLRIPVSPQNLLSIRFPVQETGNAF